jgi:gliding motility-associated-like protein
MQWTTGAASGGVGGFGGTPASVGANRGNGIDYIQFGRFDHAGTDYDGPFGASDGISFLDNKYFTFSTSVTSANVPPVVTGQSVCDSLIACTDQQTQLSVDFLSPEPDQITTPSSSAPTLSNYTVVDSVAGLNAHIVTQFTPTMADTGYHVVTFEGTDDGSPVMTSTLTIVIHVLPSPQIDPGSLLVCDNDTAVDMLTVLGGSPTTGGVWTAPDGSDHSGIFTPGVDMDGDYIYVVGGGGQCAATGTATMTNVPHAYAGEDTSLAYCSWDYPDLLFPHLPGSPQTGGYWVDPNGMVFDGNIDPPTSTPGTYLYVVVPPTPCPNDTAAIQVAIPPAVYAGTDSSIVICRDAAPFSMRSKLGGQVDTTGTWTSTLGATVPDTFDPATGEIGVYTYTVPAVLPCPDQSAVLTINIDPLPNAGIDSALVICANGGDYPLYPLLNGSTDPGSHWLDPLGQAHSGILDPSLEISGAYSYIAVGPGTCDHLTDTALVQVQINPLAVISFTADPDSGCNPLEVLFTNTTDSIYVGNSCVWDLGDGTPTVQECGSFTHTYQDPGWYHLKLQMTTPQGCTNQLIVPGAVLVDPAPLATFVWTPNPGTAGNSNIVFTGTDPHAVDFQWTINNDDLQSGQQVAHAFTDQIGGEYPVCLSVLDRYGCADTLCDTVSVIIPNLYTPLAFTPDGNGVNDIFRPYATDIVADDYEMRIFDRWGQLVFDTQDPNAGWDGKGRDGSILATGTYIWRITYRPVYTADKTDQFGTITLLK